MAKRPSITKQHADKPSKLLMLFALITAFSLPYFLVKNFAHHKHGVRQETFISQAPAEFKEIEMPATRRYSITDKQIDTPVEIKSIQPAHAAKDIVRDNVWQVIKPHQGDTLGSIFSRLGLSAQNLHEVLNRNPHAKLMTKIKINQEMQFLINHKKLEKLIIPVNPIQTLIVYRDGTHYKTKMDSKKTTSKDLYLTATVTGSLFTTARRLNIPYKLVRQMTDILNKQVNFSKTIRAGDQFSIVYNAYYVNDKLVGLGDIQAVSYTSRGKSIQAIRHNKPNGEHEYYNAQGQSSKKAFSRYPIKFSHISSTFAVSRYHPILHYKRAHKGIDLAAPIGTPIQSIGDGTIEIIDRHNGYGNMIKVKHDKTYSTIYGHMLRFQKGLSKGSKVKRGQVIGYVGQTGLATGPHCHFELHVNNQPRNPTSIALPTATPISGKELAAFKARANLLLARLKIYEETKLAAAKKKYSRLG